MIPDSKTAALPGRTAATSTDTPPPPSNRPSACIVGDDLTGQRARRDVDRAPSDYRLSRSRI